MSHSSLGDSRLPDSKRADPNAHPWLDDFAFIPRLEEVRGDDATTHISTEGQQEQEPKGDTEEPHTKKLKPCRRSKTRKKETGKDVAATNQIPDKVRAPTLTYNVSNFSLSAILSGLLQRGLGFCPTPTSVRKTLIKCLARNARHLRHPPF